MHGQDYSLEDLDFIVILSHPSCILLLLYQTVSYIRRQLESTGISSTIISATFLRKGLPVNMEESAVFHILPSQFGRKSCFLINYSSFREVALDSARMVTVVSMGRSTDIGEFAVACFRPRKHNY